MSKLTLCDQMEWRAARRKSSMAACRSPYLGPQSPDRRPGETETTTAINRTMSHDQSTAEIGCTEPETDTDADYAPLEDHFCDAYISLDDDEDGMLSIHVDEPKRERTVTVTGECDVCGRSISMTFLVNAEMTRVEDRDTGEELHLY